MEDAITLLKGLDVAEIERRLDALDRETRALRVLWRAARQLERREARIVQTGEDKADG